MKFPLSRPRRLRTRPGLRQMVRENHLKPANLVLPLFVDGNLNRPRPLTALPGHSVHPPDAVWKEARKAQEARLGGVILFGVPGAKNSAGSAAWAPKGPVQVALRSIRKNLGDRLTLFADVCLCQYTDHGHCGVLKGAKVDNDATLPLLQKTAVSQVEAGADFVAPSGMMDGAVGAIRAGLDSAGHSDAGILAYAVKYASAFYGPFREAVHSAPGFGDRKAYQMDPANAREALREARLDAEEGADILMVKPALPYLDIVSLLRRELTLPVAAFQVSGECAMLAAAARQGLINERDGVLESLVSIRRAGADIVLTYFALDAAGWLADG